MSLNGMLLTSGANQEPDVLLAVAELQAAAQAKQGGASYVIMSSGTGSAISGRGNALVNNTWGAVPTRVLDPGV